VKIRRLQLPIFCLFLVCSIIHSTKAQTKGPIQVFGIEYLYPTWDNRPIHTLNVNYLREKLQSGDKVGSDGYGLGPVSVISYKLFNAERINLAPFFSGGIMLYTKEFPTGGDMYNFMWRLGVEGGIKCSKAIHLELSVNWMHVSNGQSFPTNNPSYNAWGLGISIKKY